VVSISAALHHRWASMDIRSSSSNPSTDTSHDRTRTTKKS
jgi:hypothetical protein